jgi:galactokinase
MEESTIEKEDISRLTDSFSRETVDLVFKVADKAFEIALENFKSRKKEYETQMEKLAKNIVDLKTLKEISNRNSENFNDIFESSEFMIRQKSLIPKEIVHLSIS